ncbi:hypothetical protein [Desulforhopalus singaporensis]|uniref:Tripartite tricarboxylate transporter TctB family protein n=1 Tax=Desulforhopalus singaporensis TaxID=91360 RepID=A0A1H0KL76_9BACT|nr:hypothetical protein [Desulforhopalus singaporensis]SDO56679.1 hypothetical protein SAMN05660330_00546 [Desulforhopalus singaporensis]
MNGSILFSLFFVALFSYVSYSALGYVYLARMFPLAVGVFALVLALVNLFEDIWRLRRNIASDSGMGLSDLETDWDIAHSEVWLKAGLLIGVVIALYGGIWLIGYPLAMSIFVVLVYRFIARAKLINSCIAGMAALGFIAFVAKMLNVSWPEGLIQKLVNLPWPLG